MLQSTGSAGSTDLSSVHLGWTRPLVMSLKHRKRQIFKRHATANHTHTWWQNITAKETAAATGRWRNVHFYDGRLHHQHPLADLLSDPLFPRQWSLVGALLLGLLLLGLAFSSEDTHAEYDLYYPWLIVYTAFGCVDWKICNLSALKQTDSLHLIGIIEQETI